MIKSLTDIEKIKDRHIVLLQSGGLDSCYLACLFNSLGFEMHSVFIDYGQNSVKKERESAHKIVERYGGTLKEVKLDIPWLKMTSSLVGGQRVISRPDIEDRLGAVKGGAYVPMRNHMFISIASSLAESLKIPYIATGLDGAEDFFKRPLHGTPDKHPTFARKLEQSLSEGSSLKHIEHKNIELICPIITFDKRMTVHNGLCLDCDFSLSWTCYNDNEEPCMECDSCLQRAEAFEAWGEKDPLLKNKIK